MFRDDLALGLGLAADCERGAWLLVGRGAWLPVGSGSKCIAIEDLSPRG